MPVVADTTRKPAGTHPGPHRYRAYGLIIASDLALPELDPDQGDGPADLTIRLAPTGRGKPDGFAANTFDFTDDEQFLCWPLVGAFLIRGVSEIVVERADGVSDQLLPFPLLGPVIALVLHLRGFLILHASAVAIGGGCAVFLGDKGDGKSTTAAAFLRAGHSLVTDDLLIVDTAQGRPEVNPAFPQIKLAADAEAAVSLDGARARPLVLPDFEKRQQVLSGPFDHQRIRPEGLYVLSRGQEARATRLGPTDALSAVIRFSYISRFQTRRMHPEESREHLRQCAALANATPVYRLETPDGLDRLDEIVGLIEGHFGRK